jgi:hypothetical protein
VSFSFGIVLDIWGQDLGGPLIEWPTVATALGFLVDKVVGDLSEWLGVSTRRGLWLKKKGQTVSRIRFVCPMRESTVDSSGNERHPR